MLMRATKFFSAAGVVALAGCVSIPSGPSHQAFPGSRKSFDQFQVDDIACRDHGTAQIGGRSASDRANESAAASAVVGTIIGAAAGAAIGGNSAGAGVGAGIGLLTGSMIGTAEAQGSYHATQRRFDVAYHQCMYARGHRVPVYGRYAQSTPRSYAPPPRSTPPSNAPAPRFAPPSNLPSENIPPPNAPPPR